jgi:hypothetical protein
MTDTTLGASYQAPQATIPNPALGSPIPEPSFAQSRTAPSRSLAQSRQQPGSPAR